MIAAVVGGSGGSDSGAESQIVASAGPAKPSSGGPSAASVEPAETSAAAPEPAGPKTYRVGQTVRGGNLEFVVHGVKCGITQVGESFLNRKAQGMFCRVDTTVKNVTRKAKLFHADGTVTAQDASGRQFDSDGEANIYGNKDGSGFLDEINPGNSVRAFVYFDVPKGTKLTKVVFDAGLFTLAEDAVVSI